MTNTFRKQRALKLHRHSQTCSAFPITGWVSHWLITTRTAVPSQEVQPQGRSMSRWNMHWNITLTTSSKDAFGSLHLHKKHLGSLCLQRKLNLGKLDRTESRLRTLIPLFILACWGGISNEREMSSAVCTSVLSVWWYQGLICCTENQMQVTKMCSSQASRLLTLFTLIFASF